MALPIGALIGLGSSIIGGLFGNRQRRQANKLAKQTVAPTTTINPELLQNAALADQMAMVGLPDAQYMQALGNINRNQAGALRVASTSGRPANVASILQQSNLATGQLDAADAAARQSNQRLAMNARAAVAQDRNRVFDWDRQKYMLQLQQIGALRNAGNQNIFGAIGNVAQMAMGGTFDNLGSWIGGLFGGGNGSAALPAGQGAGFNSVGAIPVPPSATYTL